MALHLRDAICDADARRFEPDGSPIAAWVEPDTLDACIASTLSRIVDEDPHREAFFDAELHDHWVVEPSADEIRDAIATSDPAYGGLQWNATHDKLVYRLYPTKRFIQARNHQPHTPLVNDYDPTRHEPCGCLERKLVNALDRTRMLMSESASPTFLGMSDTDDESYN